MVVCEDTIRTEDTEQVIVPVQVEEHGEFGGVGSVEFGQGAA